MTLTKTLTILFLVLFSIQTSFSQGFDLASNITLAPGEDDRVYPGETVFFKVTLFNQGTVVAENVDITLMIPVGLTSVTGIANMGTITFAGPLAPGGMTMQILEFEVNANLTNSAELIIRAEISSAEDGSGVAPTDIDSTPDADFTNDAGGVVDSNTDDTVDNENGDEDDSDPENVFVEIFDLALTKKLAAGEDIRVYPGETVTFSIEVTNQGTVPASNIVVEDYMPAGLTTTGATSFTMTGPIAPGSSQSVDISFIVSATVPSTLVNAVEIQSYEDDLGESPDDWDSVADNDPNNDPTINDETNNAGGDEDDADQEVIEVEIFDLASNITLAPGEDDIANPGETVSFKVSLFNQGTVSASNVDVAFMIPVGLTSVSGIANMGTITFAGPLAPGETSIQILEFVVNPNLTSPVELILKEEISSAEDDFGESSPDIDSTPDVDFTNDAGGIVDSATDDTIHNENGDEDDSDPENIFVEILPLYNVDFISNDYPVLESLNQIDICLQLSIEAPAEVTAEVSYTGGSAEAGTDYVDFSLIQQIVFPANSIAEQCFTINLLEDNLIEMNETIEFEITNLTSIEPTAIGINNTTSITILDNDDSDNDNVENTVDNCPNNFNPNQENLDGDSFGDACDSSNVVSTIAEFQDHIYINNPFSGVIVKSPDGQCWVMVVSNNGSLNIVAVECPTE